MANNRAFKEPENSQFATSLKVCASVRAHDKVPDKLDLDCAAGFVHLQGGSSLRFTHVMGPDATQLQVYGRACQGIAASLLNGESGCVIVLGPNKSGKSYSLLGKDGDFAKMGLVGRMASDLIDKASEEGQKDGGKGNLHVTMNSFIVQEKAVRDLLSTTSERRQLGEGGSGLTECSMVQSKVTKMSEAMLLIQKAGRASQGSPGHLVFILSLVKTGRGLGEKRGAPVCEVVGSVALVEVDGGPQGFNSTQSLHLCAVLCSLCQKSKQHSPPMWKESALTNLCDAAEFDQTCSAVQFGATCLKLAAYDDSKPSKSAAVSSKGGVMPSHGTMDREIVKERASRMASAESKHSGSSDDAATEGGRKARGTRSERDAAKKAHPSNERAAVVNSFASEGSKKKAPRKTNVDAGSGQIDKCGSSGSDKRGEDHCDDESEGRVAYNDEKRTVHVRVSDPQRDRFQYKNDIGKSQLPSAWAEEDDELDTTSHTIVPWIPGGMGAETHEARAHRESGLRAKTHDPHPTHVQQQHVQQHIYAGTGDGEQRTNDALHVRPRAPRQLEPWGDQKWGDEKWGTLSDERGSRGVWGHKQPLDVISDVDSSSGCDEDDDNDATKSKIVEAEDTTQSQAPLLARDLKSARPPLLNVNDMDDELLKQQQPQPQPDLTKMSAKDLELFDYALRLEVYEEIFKYLQAANIKISGALVAGSPLPSGRVGPPSNKPRERGGRKYSFDESMLEISTSEVSLRELLQDALIRRCISVPRKAIDQVLWPDSKTTGGRGGDDSAHSSLVFAHDTSPSTSATSSTPTAATLLESEMLKAESLRLKLAAAEKSNREQMEQVSALGGELKECVLQRDGLLEQMRKTDGPGKGLAEQLTQALIRRRHAESGLAAAQRDAEEKRSKLAQVEEELTDYKQHVDTLEEEARMFEATSAANAETQAIDLELRRRENEEDSNSVVVLRGENQAFKREIERLREELASARDTSRDAHASDSSRDAQTRDTSRGADSRDTARDAVARAVEDFGAAKEAHTSYGAGKKDIDASDQEYTQEIFVRLETDIRMWKARAEAADKFRARAEQCSKAEAEVRALEIELQTQTDTARRLRKQVASLTESINKNTADAERDEKAKETMRAEIEALRTANDKLQSEVLKTQRALDDSNTTAKDMEILLCEIERKEADVTEGLLMHASKLDITLRSSLRAVQGLVSRHEHMVGVLTEEARRLRDTHSAADNEECGCSNDAKHKSTNVKHTGHVVEAHRHTRRVGSSSLHDQDSRDHGLLSNHQHLHEDMEDGSYDNYDGVRERAEAEGMWLRQENARLTAEVNHLKQQHHPKHEAASAGSADKAVRTSADKTAPSTNTDKKVRTSPDKTVRSSADKSVRRTSTDKTGSRSGEKSAGTCMEGGCEDAKVLSLEIARLQSELKAAKSALSDSQSKVEFLRDEALESSLKLQRLECEIERTTDALKESEERVLRAEQLEAEAGRLSDEVCSLQAQLAKAVQAAAHNAYECTSIVRLRDVQAAAIDEQAEQMAADLKQVKCEAETCHRALMESENEVVRMQADVKQLRDELDRTRKAALKCAQHQADLKQRDSEVIALSAEIVSMKKDAEVAVKDRLALDQERYMLAVAREEILGLKSQFVMLSKQLEDTKKEVETVEQLTCIVNQRENEVSVLSLDVARLRAELYEAQRVAVAATQEREREIVLEDENAHLAHEMRVVRADLVRWEERAARAEAGVANVVLWQEQASVLSLQLQHMRGELDAAKKQVMMYEQERVNAKVWEDQARDLTVQLQIVRAEAGELKRTLGTPQGKAEADAYKDRLTSLEEQVQVEQARVAALQLELQDRSAACSGLAVAHEEAGGLLDQMREVVRSAENKAQEMASALARAEIVAQHGRKAAEAAEAQIATVQQQRDAALRDVSELRSKVDALEKQCEQLQSAAAQTALSDERMRAMYDAMRVHGISEAQLVRDKRLLQQEMREVERALREELRLKGFELDAALRDKDRMRLSAMELAAQLDVLQTTLTTPITHPRQRRAGETPLSAGMMRGFPAGRAAGLHMSRTPLHLPDPEGR